MSDILKLQEAIEHQRSIVNELIAKGTDDEEFIRANRKLDRLIEEYIEFEIQAKHMPI